MTEANGDPAGEAAALMRRFAERTGLVTDTAAPRRDLWTDALAVLNWLELVRRGGGSEPEGLATAMIARVNGVLGRQCEDHDRTGRFGGNGANGMPFPAAGGIPIGRKRPERGTGEPRAGSLAGGADGPHFHHLTKWMDALARAAVILGAPEHHRHAVELAEASVPRFLRYAASDQPVGLAWTTGTDPSHPSVATVITHDTLDGYVTLRTLAAGVADAPQLSRWIALLAALADGRDIATSDPLGIGMLLTHAARLVRLADITQAEENLAAIILREAAAGLTAYLQTDPLAQPAGTRFAFAELGLAVGLQTLPAVAAAARVSENLSRQAGPALSALDTGEHVAPAVIAFWANAANRTDPLFITHADLNEVMLASALIGAYARTLSALPGG